MTSGENKKLEELRSKVRALKEARDELNSKLKSKRDSIMGFYGEIDKLLKEAKKLKDTRDAANKKVSEAKIHRNEFNSKIAELNKKISAMRGPEPGMSRRDYEKQKADYERLDWKMQTSPVSKDREKVMIRQLSELEAAIKEYEAAKPATKEAAALEKELRQLRKEADAQHKRLLDESEEGEKAHAAMHEIYKKVDERRAKAKKVEEVFIEIKKEVEAAHQSFVDTLNELRAEEDRLGIKRVHERKASGEKLKKDQKAKEGDLLESLRQGGVIKTEDLLLFQDVED
jgi:uncharacterized coiled-coil DUF342 family protein